MPHAVFLTAGAESDLVAIHNHILDSEGAAAADRVLQRLLEVAGRLAELPGRGSHPRELLALGIREYRQVIMRPYRIIYRIVGTQVLIVLIADSRRDMQTALARRLLGA